MFPPDSPARRIVARQSARLDGTVPRTTDKLQGASILGRHHEHVGGRQRSLSVVHEVFIE